MLGFVAFTIYVSCTIKTVASTMKSVSEYKVLLIDSVSLNLYYVIKLSNEQVEGEHVHVLSMKEKGRCSDDKRIKVGDKLLLKLVELYSFVYDIQSGDSIYYPLSPSRGSFTTENGDILYSSNVKPFYSEQLIGLCYEHE